MKRKAGRLIGLTFLGMNIISIFHAYRFTHFSRAQASVKTRAPEQLTISRKISSLLFGIENPKPTAAALPCRPYTTVTLQSRKKIQAWMMEIQDAKGTVLLFHGYTSEKSSLLENAYYFMDLGYSVVLADLMGCGESEGIQTSIGFYEAEDVHTVFQYAQKALGLPVILYGSSMGAASVMRALYLYDIPAHAVILECPFGSMHQTVVNRFRNMGVPSFPMSYLLTFWGGTINGFWAFGHNPEDYARHIKVAALIITGDSDNNVTHEEIDNICNNIGQNSTYELKVIKGARA